MSATDDFIAQCVTTVTTNQDPGATKEVVERTLRDREVAKELPLDAGVRVLHGGENLTILHVVMPERPVGAGNPIPHNHRMWALIGVIHGSEHNRFFRPSDGTIEFLREQEIEADEVLALDEDAIHSVRNPSTDRLSSALHVYGGNLIAAVKTMWCEPDLVQEPFDFLRVIGS
jgi:predicted metal-dependent enzyme (double-stranded beta helix superfamily)